MDANKKAARETAIKRLSENLGKMKDSETVPVKKVRAQGESDVNASDKVPYTESEPPKADDLTPSQRKRIRDQVLQFLHGGGKPNTYSKDNFYELNKDNLDGGSVMHAEDFEEPKQSMDMSAEEKKQVEAFLKRLREANKDQE